MASRTKISNRMIFWNYLVWEWRHLGQHSKENMAHNVRWLLKQNNNNAKRRVF